MVFCKTNISIADEQAPYSGQRKNIQTLGQPTSFHQVYPMAKLIIEPKKTKDGQIEYVVNYHDPKSDNSFTITITNDLNEAVDKLKSTLEGEVMSMQQK
jgi:NAD-dependent SIR2 family protein deacetylase